jgi:hypothetical protein
VAFWADEKYVSGLDRFGVEWLLSEPTTLQALLEDEGLMQVHRSTLLRRDCVTKVERRRWKDMGIVRIVYGIGGREFVASRRYSQPKNPTYMEPGLYENGERVGDV